jgi:cytosine/creatinine deaminase
MPDSQSKNTMIRNALVWGKEDLQDLAMRDGYYVQRDDTFVNAGFNEIDAAGKLCFPAFVDPHIHLDKVLINESVRTNATGTLTEAIEIIWERKKHYTVDDIVQRAGRVIMSAVSNGVTHIRTHVDVDNIGGLLPVQGLIETRNKYADIVDLQIVAFPQEGILQNEGTSDLMKKAMELGADVVGGMPFNEKNLVDSAKHIEFAFNLAKEFDADIDMHVDETDDPAAKTLEILARQTIENDWQGRVTAGHTCALAGYTPDYADQVIQLVKEAGMHMITNPATNLMLQGRLDEQPKRRGITRVKELMAEGINVSFGQDCIKDTFYPFGREDPLEVAFLTAHAAHLSQPDEINQVFDMPIRNAARIMRLKNFGTDPGCKADLVILDARSPAEAITKQADKNIVIKRGNIIAEMETHYKFHWEPK